MASRAKRRRHTRGQPRRWVAFVLALGAATGALWLLVAEDPGAPLEEIDAASRQELERLLERSDREESR